MCKIDIIGSVVDKKKLTALEVKFLPENGTARKGWEEGLEPGLTRVDSGLDFHS